MTIQLIANAGFWKHRTCLWRMAALKYYRLAKQGTCTWCGYVGPREKVAVHILECVKHPMGELARQWLEEKQRAAGKIAALEADNLRLRVLLEREIAGGQDGKN